MSTSPSPSASQPNTTSAKRGGPKGPRTLKPRFEVQGQVPRKKVTFELPETALKILADYAAFLSNGGGYTVLTDSIVERLLKELARDNAFKAHLARLESKARPGARSAEGGQA